MIAVDSNILAYLLMDGGRTAEARLLLERDPDWHSDAFALVELTNMFATAIRARQLDLSRGDLVEHRQAVCARGDRVACQELPERIGVFCVDSLVGVEEDDPIGLELRRGRKEAPPVGPIVPLAVTGPLVVREHHCDVPRGAEKLRGAVGAAVVEGNDRVGESGGRLEPVADLSLGVTRGKETRDHPGVIISGER